MTNFILSLLKALANLLYGKQTAPQIVTEKQDSDPFQKVETPTVIVESPAQSQPETVIEENPQSNVQDIAFELVLHVETKDSTISKLYHRGKYLCLILEDGHRDKKEYGQTRIPGGIVELIKRKEGKFFAEYRRRFNHSFVVELKDVVGFKFILVHIGNTIKDTLGCLLTGTSFSHILEKDVLYVRDSTEAYLKWYKAVESEFAKGGKVFMRIDRGSMVVA